MNTILDYMPIRPFTRLFLQIKQKKYLHFLLVEFLEIGITTYSYVCANFHGLKKGQFVLVGLWINSPVTIIIKLVSDLLLQIFHTADMKGKAAILC